MTTLRRVTLRDIAARIGVSHVTVSLALKNHPDISKGRREQVQALAKEMGYRPDPALASLMVYRQSRKGLAVSSALAWVSQEDQSEKLRNPREVEAYRQGASEAAELLGYHLEELVWPEDCSADRFEKTLLARNVRGVLIPPGQMLPSDLGGIFSTISLGESARHPASRVVGSDQLRAVVTAMEHLREYGYERIGFVCPSDWDGGVVLSAGYFAARQRFGLVAILSALETGLSILESDPERGQEEFQSWYHKNQPDAILTTVAATRDHLAALNLSVPGDVALAGMSVDNLGISAGIDPNSLEIGRAAVEVLVSLINNNDRGRPVAPRRILIEGLWRDGDSLPRRRGAGQ